ncbi:MAG: VPS10 domain-containing protein [Acidimicrobiia bacterium]
MAPHTPHDDVYDIAVSPDFAADGVVFALCRDMFLKSTDGGRTWHNIVRGLNNMWQYFTDTAQRFSVDMSMRDKRVMFFASRGDGVYKSTDEGWSWSKIKVTESDGQVSLLAISPHRSDDVIAASANGGLHRTTDCGDTWTELSVSDATVTAIAYAPDRDGVIVLGDDMGQLHQTQDGGATWSTHVLRDVGSIRTVAISPGFSSDGTIMVGTSLSGVYRSTDGGVRYAVKNAGLADTSISSIAFSPAFASDATLWVSTWTAGVFTSWDGAECWTQTSVGLTRNTQKYEARYEKRPHFGRILAANGARSAESCTLLLGGFDGFFHSTDGGHTWAELETLPSTLPISIGVSPDFATDGSVAVTTYINGAHMSEDRGDTWFPINNGLEERVFMQQRPDRIARLFGIAFSPAYASDKRLLCSNWTRFLQSMDRGRRWTVRNLTPESLPLQQFKMSISPDYGRDGTVFLGNRFGEVWKSQDGGVSFGIVSKLGGHVRAIAISPDYADDSTIFASAATGVGDVYVSTDGGVMWSPMGMKKAVTHLAISPAFSSDATLFAATGRGLYVTRDAGKTWDLAHDAHFGATSNIEALAVSPSFDNDGTVLVSVPGTGLFKSVDGGFTFVATGRNLLDMNVVFANIPNAVAAPIVFSPDYRHDQTVFGYAPSGVYRSTDGGEHWTDITPPTTTHPMPKKILPTPKADHSEIVQRPGSSAEAVPEASASVPRRAAAAVNAKLRSRIHARIRRKLSSLVR